MYHRSNGHCVISFIDPTVIEAPVYFRVRKLSISPKRHIFDVFEATRRNSASIWVIPSPVPEKALTPQSHPC
jgi:hypothetical protein